MRSIHFIIVLALFLTQPALAQEKTPPLPKLNDQSATTTVKVPSAPAKAQTENGSQMIDPSSNQIFNSTDNSLRPAMLEELQVARDQNSMQVQQLSEQLGQNTSDSQRMDIQRQISDLKSGMTLKSLTIQLKYARLGGFNEQAEELVTIIEEFETRRDTPRSPINTQTTRDASGRGGEVR